MSLWFRCESAIFHSRRGFTIVLLQGGITWSLVEGKGQRRGRGRNFKSTVAGRNQSDNWGSGRQSFHWESLMTSTVLTEANS